MYAICDLLPIKLLVDSLRLVRRARPDISDAIVPLILQFERSKAVTQFPNTLSAVQVTLCQFPLASFRVQGCEVARGPLHFHELNTFRQIEDLTLSRMAQRESPSDCWENGCEVGCELGFIVG